MNKQPLIILTGPTAVGKTDISIELAQKLNAEILSADSMQVYRHMDIGTAKPTTYQQKQVKHHLIDLVEPDQDFSVADYQACFQETLEKVVHQGKLPLMVGGTGLYIRACTQAFVFDPDGADPELRAKLRAEAEQFGADRLHRQLAKVDPQSAARVHPNDLVRIIRALEVYSTTGTPLSELQPKRNQEIQFNTIFIFLDRNREELYQRIEERVDVMFSEGFVDEIRSLLERGYTPDLKPLQSLGYRQVSDFLMGKIPLNEAIAQTKQQTRHYAKRQLTWFRREPVDFWLNLSGRKQEFIGEILRYIEGRLDLASNKLS